MVGRWISFDEQTVRCNHRTAKFMQRHMPNKPIKNGEWSVELYIACVPVRRVGNCAGSIKRHHGVGVLEGVVWRHE